MVHQKSGIDDRLHLVGGVHEATASALLVGAHHLMIITTVRTVGAVHQDTMARHRLGGTKATHTTHVDHHHHLEAMVIRMHEMESHMVDPVAHLDMVVMVVDTPHMKTVVDTS